jgi:hypothetical protein
MAKIIWLLGKAVFISLIAANCPKKYLTSGTIVLANENEN